MNNSFLLLHLAQIDGIGPQTVLSLIASVLNVSKDDLIRSAQLMNADLTVFYQYKISDFMNHGLSQKIARKLVDELANQDEIEKESDEMEKHDIRWVSFCDVEYPELLRHIHAPPIGLYVKGAGLKSGQLHCGVVGSRMAGAYAESVIDVLVTPFILSDGIVVSGGALGVDGMAHTRAVQCQKPTIVVLGSGLLSLYPRQHLSLFDRILATGGSLISPFSLHTGPDRFNFPIRNRIIAGLSKAVLVVQAAEKSGALITAEYALQEGRSVMAIPGSIDDPLSAGCHKLLKQGALLVTSYQDLCDEMGMQEMGMSEQKIDFVQQEEKDPLLVELKVAHHIESLALKLNQTLDDTEDRLFTLQLDGLVIQRIDGSWIRS
ncbi:DNA-protecting protein DprA [Candidatus Babeliales bacterium]|nr:DNA-protecting protein DprA [Candidatus Babeliales bacterium]